MIKKIALICTLFTVSIVSLWASEEVGKTLLPKPTGEYQIATQKLFLTDSLRKEKFTTRRKYREIYVKVWYPVRAEGEYEYEYFLDDYPTKVVADIFKSVGLDRDLVDLIKQTQTHSLSEDFELPSGQKFPVILFNPGFYFGMSDFYTAIIENLASHGYIVCSINHPYEQPYVESSGKDAYMKKKKAQLAYLQLFLMDKFRKFKIDTEEEIEAATRVYLKKLSRFDKVVRRWTADNEFFISYLENESKNPEVSGIIEGMDLNRLGVLGQSVGGSVAGQVCLHNKDRVKAGINLDCFQFGDIIDQPLETPFMLMQSDHYFMWNLGNSIIFRNPQADFYRTTIKNARHFVFSDASFLDLIDAEEKKKMIGDVDGEESAKLINSYILAFFNFYLSGESSALMNEEIDTEIVKFEKFINHAN
ncbi:MAG TPA: hypothetical protein VJ855_05185 [Marinilabiliaceae bacterium]|nr:hypothetical protein [Marinilabiliaceae bacterium]